MNDGGARKYGFAVTLIWGQPPKLGKHIEVHRPLYNVQTAHAAYRCEIPVATRKEIEVTITKIGCLKR